MRIFVPIEQYPIELSYLEFDNTPIHCRYILNRGNFIGISKPIAFFYMYPIDLSDAAVRLQYLEECIFGKYHCHIPSKEWNVRLNNYARKHLCSTR